MYIYNYIEYVDYVKYVNCLVALFRAANFGTDPHGQSSVINITSIHAYIIVFWSASKVSHCKSNQNIICIMDCRSMSKVARWCVHLFLHTLCKSVCGELYSRIKTPIHISTMTG